MPFRQNSPFWHGRNQLFAYLLIVAVMLFGFYRIENTNDRVRSETRQSVFRQCVTVNLNRTAIREILDSITAGSQQRRDFIVNNPLTSATEKQEAEDALARTKEFINNAKSKVPLQDCEKLPHDHTKDDASVLNHPADPTKP
jgi:hypothetical protein